MGHIEEHILEMVVLEPDQVGDQKEEIERHLAECNGCRALFEEISAFHRELQSELQRPPLDRGSGEKALAKVERAMRTYFDIYDDTQTYRPRTALGRIWHFVRRRPVISGAGGIALVSLAVALIVIFGGRTLRDTNPVTIRYDDAGGYLQILNREDQELWKIATQLGMDYGEGEYTSNMAHTVLEDLTGDGIKEVITIVRTAADAQAQKHGYLRVLDSKKNELWKKDFIRKFEYRDAPYGPTFWPSGMVIIKDPSTRRSQIFVGAATEYSPTFICRFDDRGEVLGEYWHFGQLGDIYAAPISGEGGMKILLTGSNDVDEAKKEQFPAIIILDPDKLKGRAKSTTAPGFVMPVSDAELYYLRLPSTDIDSAVGAVPSITRFYVGDDSLFRFRVTTKRPDSAEMWNFEYVFSRDMKCVDVKPSTPAIRKRKELAQAGATAGEMGAGFVRRLIGRIGYWDGNEWRNEPVRVGH